jgi:putative tricarboxylic transport membrane protein
VTRDPDVIGAAIVATVGVLVIAGALTTPDPGFGVVGPGVLPAAIGVLMLGSAGWLLRDALLGRARSAVEALDGRPLALSALALAAFFAAFVPLGFVLASTAFLVVEARILGSRALLRDLLVAAGFVVVLYLLFVRFLTINLPTGPLPL